MGRTGPCQSTTPSTPIPPSYFIPCPLLRHLTPREVSCAAVDIPACLSSVHLPSNSHSLGQTLVLVACTPATWAVIRRMDPGIKLVQVLYMGWGPLGRVSEHGLGRGWRGPQTSSINITQKLVGTVESQPSLNT